MTTIAMAKLTAADLIARQKAVMVADNERMTRRPAGTPRGAWREINPIDGVVIDVQDTAFETRPMRRLSFDLNGSATDLWVWSTGRRQTVVERIDLGASDADERLARYVPVVA